MMVSIAAGLTVIGGLWLMTVSVLMLLRPDKALRLLAMAASTNVLHFGEQGLRLLWGLALLTFAAASRFPYALHLLGLILAVTSVLLMLIPRRWHAAYALYWADKLSPRLVRLLAPLPAAAGLFFVAAVGQS